jgi:hypothetical protein
LLLKGKKMADKHWIKDLNGSIVIVIDFIESSHVRVRIDGSGDTEIWPVEFWRALPPSRAYA